MDSKQFKTAAYSSIDHIVQYYDTIEDRRVTSNVQPGYLRKLLPDQPPEEGESWTAIQSDIDTKILPGLTHWQSPRFMAWYPSNSSFPGILGELYSAAFNGPMFNWICSPAATELETIVLDWLALAFGLPECFHSKTAGGGVIQGSASEAIVTVMVAARDRYLRESTAHITDEKSREDAFYTRRGSLVALGSEMAHSSTQKAAQIAGVRFRSIPTRAENDFALTGSDVEAALRQCKDEGLEPFYLTVTLGTTATCAVDDFDDISKITDKEPLLWVHVDAAYAGSALICPEYQTDTALFECFNSYDMNLHKWLLVNFDASCLWVKNRRHLTDALSIDRSYFRNEHTEGGLVTDYRDWQIPLGRRFRSLKIWFVIRTYGTNGLRSYIRNHIELGDGFAGLIESRQDLFRLFVKPRFALTLLQVRPRAGDMEDDDGSARKEANLLTQRLYERINAQGEIMVTSAVIHEAYVIRVVNCTPRTEARHLKRAFDILVQGAEDLRSTQ